MVELTNDTKTGRNFEGKVTKVEVEPAKGDFPEQYRITIEAVDKEWKPQTCWISIPATSTENKVPRRSLLGFFIDRLGSFDIKAETHKETIEAMFGRTFAWKDELPKVDGEVLTRKEKLIPCGCLEVDSNE